ncbi:MAG: hypothetical protein EOO38_10020 [Cytophagaceae bacterium]|nr:MAG: hypothetical protein EOO38_10020 [Cytophagaceae bacterium]
MRVLAPEHIPNSLWTDNHIVLPPALVDAYRSELISRELYDRALTRSAATSVGGATEEETDEHFTQMFVNSASRVLYALLSPCNTFNEASDTLIASLSYGNVGILDIPCGTGAMSATMIGLLIELRQSNVLPKLPLTLTVCAGDFSAPSRSVCLSLLDRLVDEASSVGITLRHSVHHWDALDHQDTAALIDEWFSATETTADHLVTILNFSGEMHKADVFDKFSPSINNMLGRLYSRKGAVIWLEPGTNQARKALRKNFNAFLDYVPFLSKLKHRYTGVQRRFAEYDVRDPLTDAKFPSQVTEICFYAYFPREVSCQRI